MPLTRPVPWNSMKLNGVAGDVEPGGMSGTFPQRSTWMLWPWKCSFSARERWFQLPPSPAVAEQPGYTLPPKFSLFPFSATGMLRIGSILCPPPVIQHADGVHWSLCTTKLRSNSVSSTVVVNEYEPPGGIVIDASLGSEDGLSTSR